MVGRGILVEEWMAGEWMAEECGQGNDFPVMSEYLEPIPKAV